MIETGTYLGEMVQAVIEHFDIIASVELSESLYNDAKKKFKSNKNVVLYQGDSGKMIGQMIDDLPCKSKICFWLDGHYSAGITAKAEFNTPIYMELHTIFEKIEKDCVVLIDDARCFVGKDDYPTIEQLYEVIHTARPECLFEIKNDIIRVVF